MHQALYRRYRPKNFDNLLGQNHIITILKNQIKGGNIGHAYLFSGTRGTGKTSAAKIFSRAVNCLSPEDGNPCNKCSNCLEILEDRTMDVIEMDAASYNSVDDIRELRDKVVYLPAKIKYKVYIIDEVHMLSKGAFNALLKTLEEPPKHLIFILATTEPEKLPQTILSRCQRFDYRRIGNADIVLNMQNILRDLNISAEEKALNLIARNSDGAMRDALSLLDQCVSYNDKSITYEDTIDILGIANKDLIFNMVEYIMEQDIEKALESIDDILQAGKSSSQFMRDLINHFRDLMIVKTSKQSGILKDIDELEGYSEQSKAMNVDYILKALDILTNAETQGKWSTHPRIILEMAVIKLVNIDRDLSLEDRIRRLEEGSINLAHQDKLAIKEKPAPPKEVPVPPKETPTSPKENPPTSTGTEAEKPASDITTDFEDLDLEAIKERWPDILQEIKSTEVRVYAFAVEGDLRSFASNRLTIGYKEGFGFHQQAISAPNRKELVEKIVGSFFNRKINIDFIMVNDKIEEEPVKVDKEKAIKEVLDYFGEDIVEIK